ncbi:MAG: hypothetical protein K0R57_5586 [Paenibacillaceae bacterium]|nr:hypothetical protein [Paenibacillaceae bacterium]
MQVPLDAPVIQDGVEIRYFSVQRPRFWGTSRQLAKALKRDIPQYDLVHIHSLYLFHGLMAGYYCRKFGVPYVICPHGSLDPFLYGRHRFRKAFMEWLFENRNIKHAAAMHFTTQEEMRLAKPVTFEAQGFVVPNGLDLAEYDRLPPKGQFRGQYPQLEGKRMLLFFSRLNFKKGLDILVKAFSAVKKEHPDTMLVITGPDNENYGVQVKQWIGEEGLQDDVLFTGMLTGEDKLAVLNDADLFVLPSYSENFGIAVIEALACGVPVVISDKVNIWREVAEYPAGRVAPCDPDAFSRQIGELLSDQPAAKQLGENGVQLVRDYYQWSHVGKVLEDEYSRIIGGRRETVRPEAVVTS